MNLGLFVPFPEQRVRLENISSVQGNIILCEKLKTNLCRELRNTLPEIWDKMAAARAH